MTHIVLFEDDQNLRKALRDLINRIENYVVIGDFDDCLHADDVMRQLKPDLVIMDIDLPGRNGIEGVRMIKEISPVTPVIMHTVFEDEDKLFESLCAGANGYLLKNSSFQKLLNAIDEVMQGGAPLSPSIAKRVLESFQITKKTEYNLSSREIEILSLLVKGFSYKMIAAKCFISFETVRVHIRNIYNKLHVNCGREAVALALKNQIV